MDHTPKKPKLSAPIEEIKSDLLNLISKSQIVIICGETGSGKTTILPKLLYDYNSQIKFKLAVTQPRRIAAISVAQRVAETTKSAIGSLVGYSVRFEEQLSKSTQLKFLTDGKLLREVIQDPLLSDYTHVMVDEAHERTLSTDILIPLLKEVCRKRPDFKLLISSATLDASKFSKFLNNAPVFNVPGRTHPVKILHTASRGSGGNQNYLDNIVQTVIQIHTSEPLNGDILVFLPGKEEIEYVEEDLQNHQYENRKVIKEMIITKVYSAMPTNQQHLIFSTTPLESRKIVLATNIAETSITIPGIKYVVDSGKVKQTQFDGRSGTESLTTINCSKASCNQRTGRAGRVGPGVCYRVFSQQTFTEMDDHTCPEILRSNLASVILFLLTLGIKNVLQFEFIDKLDTNSYYRALRDLYALGAINKDVELTKDGRLMAEYPMDPKLSRCILYAIEHNCLENTARVIAMLGETKLFVSAGRDQTRDHGQDPARVAHLQFIDDKSDHLTLLNVYKAFEQNSNKRWCQRHYLDYNSLTSARKTVDQIMSISQRVKQVLTNNNRVDTNTGTDTGTGTDTVSGDDTSAILEALCSGFFLNTASLSYNKESYILNGSGTRAFIHPSSVLFKQSPAPSMILFNEMLCTKKEYLRVCTSITLETLNKIAPHFNIPVSSSLQ